MRIGPYHLHRKLGSGGMANVWHGVHVEHGVDVAVKVLHRSFASEENDNQFRREVAAVAMLDHPGIIRILDFGAVGPDVPADAPFGEGAPYLVVEYADAGNLQERMQADDFGWDDTREVLLQILDALGHAHARGLIHRDLKPDNLLGFSDGRWKLADFGIATLLAAQEQTERNPSGTPLYMSPEQFRGRLADTGSWSDLYSLGCVAYQLVTGAPPFESPSTVMLAQMHIAQPPEPVVPRFEVPVGVGDWIMRLLQKPPMSRFQRAADAAAALERLGEAVSSDVVRPRPGSRGMQRVTSDPTILTPGLEMTQLLGEAFQPSSLARFEAVRPGDRPSMPDDWREPPRPPRSLLDGTSTRLFGLRATPLVGRFSERDALWELLGAVARGESRTVILRGNSGAGKTRLGEWLRVRAHELGVASVVHAVSGRDATASQSPPAAIARHLMLAGIDSAELASRLEDLQSQLGVDARVALLVLEARSRLESGDDELPRAWVEACARLLAASTRGRPLIVSVDDLQWAPLWVEFFTRAPVSVGGVLFLATVQNEAVAQRPEIAAQLEAAYQARDAHVIDIGELEHAECHELVGDLLRLEPVLAQRIARRAGGNPMFATQLVGDWVSRGWLVARADGWHLQQGVDPELPDNLHEVWQARLAQTLEGSALAGGSALEIAAVLGKNVDGPEWDAVLAAAGAGFPAGPDAVLSHGRALVDALVLNGLAARTEDGWSFAHDMLRESVLRGAREGGRYESANALVAEVLLQLGKPVPSRIGRHLFESGQFESALEPLFDGVNALIRTNDTAGAVELLDMWRSAARRSGADEASLARGELLRAQLLQRLRKAGEATELARRVLDEADRLGHTEISAAAHALLARLSNTRGSQLDSLGHAEKALALYRALDDTAGMADAHLRLADYYSYAANLPLSRTHYLAAAEAASASADSFSHAWASWGVGFVDYQLGQLDEAREHLQRSIGEFAEIGDVYYHHVVMASLADVERSAANFDEAHRLYDLCESFMVTAGPLPATLAVNRALLELMRGRIPAARAQIDIARKRLQDDPAPNVLLAVHAFDACLAARDEDLPAWANLMSRIPPLVEEINVVEYDFVWTFEQSLREAAGRFPAEAVIQFVPLGARYWRRLGRDGEAASLEELGRRL